MDQEEFHKRQTSYIKNPNDDPDLAKSIDAFKAFSSYVPGGYEDGESFNKLNEYLEEIETRYQVKERNRIFYLALPPSVFIAVAKNLKEHCYVPKHGINRIIIEKPFGKDLESARELLSAVKQYWTEEETFRIDHYLGKEMVKNLLVLRFANIAMGAAWDKNSISNVQITFKEPFGTEGRGGYFDEFGIIRDILQNRQSFLLRTVLVIIVYLAHTDVIPGIDLLQVLSVLTMERPVSFSAEDIRDEKVIHFSAGAGHRVFNSLLYFCRSRSFVQFLPSNETTACSANTLLRMASPVTLMMTLSPPIQSALPTLPPRSGSITPAGKVSRSFSRPAKV